MFRLRVRFFFTVQGPARYLSQLDFFRSLERASRRARIPLRMSEGFNPRPRFSFPSARPVGVESRREVCEMELTRPVDLDALIEGFNVELPVGVRIVEGAFAVPSEKVRLEAVRYFFRFAAPQVPARLAVDGFRTSPEHLVSREGRKRPVDVRHFVQDIHLDGDTLVARVAVEDAGSVRPEEILRAVKFSGDPATVSITREVICAQRKTVPASARAARPLIRRGRNRRR